MTVNDDPPNPAEALAQLRRLSLICDRVEQAWQQGGRPRIEEELATVSETDRPALLGELLLLEWTYRRHNGEAVDVAAYQQRFAASADVMCSAWRRWLDGTTIDTTNSVASSTISPVPRPTYRQAEPIPAEVAHLPSGYTNLEILGEGGMGVVYRAADPRLGRKVALKRLNRLTPDRLERFRKEAMVLARFQHPNVVQVFHLDDMAGEPVIVMEYVAGGSLEQLLQNGPLSADRSAQLVATLARAVGAAHAAGVVHRDLKPANVLLAVGQAFQPDSAVGQAFQPDTSGSIRLESLTYIPKIADFGLARVLDDPTGGTLSDTICGTPAYMAPEQARGNVSEVGAATDVWALGVILYRCLTGRLPFAGESVLNTLEKVKMCPPEPFQEMEGVPTELAAVCVACMMKVMGQRPTTEQLASRLERFASSPAGPPAQVQATHEFATPPVQRPRWRWKAVAAVVGVLALTGLIMAGLTLLNRPPNVGGENTQLSPPQITRFRVLHRRVVIKDGKKTTENHGEIGKDSFEPRFDDAVQVEVALSAEGYLYLLALNPNGKVQLLWPEAGGQAKVRELRWPPRQTSGEEGGFHLDDAPAGGLQALALVVASERLPAYEDWKRKPVPVSWQKMPGGKGVWLALAAGVREVTAGTDNVRGTVKALPGTGETEFEKLLRRVVQDLRQGGAETVEVLAFPVRAKEGR
jgi:serine/threonine protein kinase